MKTSLHIPAEDSEERIVVHENLLLQTTAGLVKKTNEDSVGCFINGAKTRICVADGHWGEQASRKAVQYWIEKVHDFPTNISLAITKTKELEQTLYESFGKSSMDENKDFTPETSFTCVEILNNQISIVSYGDTRLIVANNGKVKYKQPIQETWLGAFSYLELRNRTPAERATIFTTIELDPNDHVFLFTDGVDQCVYGKDTIPLQTIVGLSTKQRLGDIFDSVFQEILKNGAEDNASFVAFKHPKAHYSN